VNFTTTDALLVIGCISCHRQGVACLFASESPCLSPMTDQPKGRSYLENVRANHVEGKGFKEPPKLKPTHRPTPKPTHKLTPNPAPIPVTPLATTAEPIGQHLAILDQWRKFGVEVEKTIVDLCQSAGKADSPTAQGVIALQTEVDSLTSELASQEANNKKPRRQLPMLVRSPSPDGESEEERSEPLKKKHRV
jgi:hypothetical protein